MILAPPRRVLCTLALSIGLLAAAACPAVAGCLRSPPSAAMNRLVGVDVAGSASFGAAVVNEVNYQRCTRGLAPVATDRAAMRAARHHSVWMARAGVMSHHTTSRGRQDFAKRLRAEGITVRVRSFENIADLRHLSVAGLACHMGRRIPTEAELARTIVRMWIDSPAHRVQTLDPHVTRAGSGAAVSLGARTCGAIFLTLTLYG